MAKGSRFKKRVLNLLNGNFHDITIDYITVHFNRSPNPGECYVEFYIDDMLDYRIRYYPNKVYSERFFGLVKNTTYEIWCTVDEGGNIGKYTPIRSDIKACKKIIKKM